MVAKIITGKSIRKALYYNENKVTHKEAILLDSGGFLKDVGMLSFRQKLDRFTSLTRLNERTKTNAVHISLNFSNRDVLNEEMLCSIAKDYLQQIGWGNQPFLLYQHFDAAHPHVHIVTTNIDRNGNRLETHNIGKNQSERARKSIEDSFGLIKAEDQHKEHSSSLAPIDVDAVVYGKQPTKAAISRVVREVMATYKFSSFQEYNAILAQFNVYADRGSEDSVMHQKGGLQYRLLNEDGELKGIPIKASSIYTSPTLANIEKLLPQHKLSKKPYAERAKHILSKAIMQSHSLEALEQQLREKGYRLLFYRGAQDNIFGISVIDNATRCIFKGSELGKDFSAARLPVLLEQRFNKVFDNHLSQPPKLNKEQAPAHFPAQGHSVFFELWSEATSDEHMENTPAMLRKKRKNLGLQ